MIAMKLFTTLGSLAAVGAVALGGLLAGPANALAAPPAPEGTPGPLDGARLELLCRQQGRALAAQQDRLDFSGEVAQATQEWIDLLKAEGKDTSALEAALADFDTAADSAQAAHDEAQAGYDTQAGFDGNCGLIDREQAGDTLRSVGDLLREAHREFSDAGRALRRAVQDWRKANRPTATP